MVKYFLIIFALLIIPIESQAVVGVRALSMGGAYVAVGGDGSALYWNPALVQEKKIKRYENGNWGVYYSRLSGQSESSLQDNYLAIYGYLPLEFKKSKKRKPYEDARMIKGYQLVSSNQTESETISDYYPSTFRVWELATPESVEKKKFIEVKYYSVASTGLLTFWMPRSELPYKEELVPYTGKENIEEGKPIFVGHESYAPAREERKRWVEEKETIYHPEKNEELLHKDKIKEELLGKGELKKEERTKMVLKNEPFNPVASFFGAIGAAITEAFVVRPFFGGGYDIYKTRKVVEKYVNNEEFYIDEYEAISPDALGGGVGWFHNETDFSSSGGNSYAISDWLQFSGFYSWGKDQRGIGASLRYYSLRNLLRSSPDPLVNTEKWGTGLDLSYYSKLSPQLDLGVLLQDISHSPIILSNGTSVTYDFNAHLGFALHADDANLLSIQGNNIFRAKGENPGLSLGFEHNFNPCLALRIGSYDGRLTWGAGLDFINLKLDFANLTRQGEEDSVWLWSIQGSL